MNEWRCGDALCEKLWKQENSLAMHDLCLSIRESVDSLWHAWILRLFGTVFWSGLLSTKHPSVARTVIVSMLFFHQLFAAWMNGLDSPLRRGGSSSASPLPLFLHLMMYNTIMAVRSTHTEHMP